MELNAQHDNDAFLESDAAMWAPFSRDSISRFLAGDDKEAAGIDYTVLTVAVLTLGLLLVVEFFRHQIDHLALGKPFFSTVLEGVYRELATLGMVEFGIYLLQTYYTEYNKEAKEVFADVHFMLFYAAIFNALESVLLAIVTSRVSDRLWVKTEQLDVDNYLELREEYEKVESELSQRGQLREDQTAEVAFEWNAQGFKRLRDGIWESLHNPRLKRKRNNLLIQVRFHELRVHFLKANKLPLKLKVSDYLKRSEMHVLKKMVHISPFAWLLLTGGLNLTYFLMGMVAYVTEDLGTVGTSMSAIFIGSLFAMVIVTLSIFNKVKSIFRSIMHNKLIDYVPSPEESSTDGSSIEDESSRRQKDQLELFWGGEPKYIIGMVQFMQIGFSIGISILIVFPDEIEGEYIKAWHYFLMVAFSYGLFIVIAARVIPRYTLCTSLGQLVNKRRLQETLAAFHLDEARKKQRILKDIREAEEAYILSQKLRESKRSENNTSESKGSDQAQGSADGNLPALMQLDTTRSARSLLSALDLAGGKKQGDHAGSLDESQGSMDRALLAELVETKTEDLRSVIPKELLTKKSREERVKARRQNRKKAVSDGVALMRAMRPAGKMSGAALSTLSSVDDDDAVQSMSSASIVEPSAVAEGDLQQLVDAPTRPRRRERARRKKSLSANAAIEMMKNLTLVEEGDKNSPLTRSPPRGRTSLNPLTEVHEDIPIMTVPASDLNIPVGRHSFSLVDENKADPHQQPTTVGFFEPERTPAPEQQVHAAVELAPEPSSAPRNTVRFFEEPKSYRPPDSSRPSEGSSKGDGSAIEGGDDDDTVDTAGSDDGHSDVDDVPDVDHSVMDKQEEPETPLSDRAREFFRGRIYKHMSAVFGTMICFFLVGMRVEALLHAAHTVDDPGNTWEFNAGTAFWIEAGWLSMFIIVSSFVIFLFRPVDYPMGIINMKRKKMFLAGILDVFLCSMCLALLMVSETQRTCDETEDDSEGRNLAESGINCSQTFGNRVGDGVGNIEPFTSLVALRLLRFFVARKFVGFWYRNQPEYQKRGDDRESFRLGIYDQTVRVDQHVVKEQTDHSHTAQDMQHNTGTLEELWHCAIGLYPDIVEKYGEFSGELLQAMLGLEVVDKEQVQWGAAKGSKPSTAQSSPVKDTNSNASVHTEVNEPVKPSMTLGRRYSALPVEAQSVILAGKLGKPVRSVSVGSSLDGLDKKEASMEKNVSQINGAPSPAAETTNRAPLAPLEFEVDTEKYATEISNANHDANTDSSPFIAPNARLIRSMRRCDKKLLPLLDKWTTVDVVMTKFEIVYFEAPTVYEQDKHANGAMSEMFQKGKAVHQAVIATCGGKGLRLGDVAEGRKVVGHLELASVEAIHVERSVPKRNEIPSDTQPPDDLANVNDEFWKPHSYDGFEIGGFSRDQRWELVKQDKLIVDSIHGMLHLRFFSDLEDAEVNPDRLWNERESDGELHKNNALQWCQTVVRLCGTQQLKKEHLPHYGHDNSDELRDYIVVDDHNMRDVQRITKVSKMRRAKSTASLTHLLERKSIVHPRGTSSGDKSPASVSSRQKSVMRGSSFGEQSSISSAKGSLTRSRTFGNMVSSSFGKPSSTPSPDTEGTEDIV